ncbi:MAG: hypothetical protein KDC71_05330 [Acidobacteria bacterium]|nr:hypothetical protein [Acidobacteriota bacterium]
MWFSKKKPNTRIDDRESLQIIFRKMLAQNLPFYLRGWGFDHPLYLVEETDKSLTFSLRFVDLQKCQPKGGAVEELTLFYEGKEYEGHVKITGLGKLDGQDAMRVSFPSSIQLNDQFQLTHYHMPPGAKVSFTSIMNEFLEGTLVNVGTRGIDLRWKDEGNIKEKLVQGRETSISFELDSFTKVNGQGRVLYFVEFGKPMVGVEFTKVDSTQIDCLEAWLEKQIKAKQTREKQAFQSNWNPAAAQRKKGQDGEDKPPDRSEILAPDFEPIFNEADPYVLLASPNLELLEQVGRSLSGSFGVLITRGTFQNIRILYDKFKPKMIVLHEDLGNISGFDLVKSLLEHYSADLAILMMGDRENEQEKMNQAMRAGAVDFLVVNPFDGPAIADKVESIFDLIVGPE